MASGEDEIMAPVLNGLCHYESLLDGTVNLADIARMNDAYAVRKENEARARDAAERKQ